MADAANDLMISRIIEAPRDALWRCWVEPELLKQWFCPKPWYVSEEIDHSDPHVKQRGRRSDRACHPRRLPHQFQHLDMRSPRF